MKISIIVPIYNVEKYLERCISSLINQTYKNIEIILVNDGSTDNSLIICEKYKDIDSRIILVNKENGGLSDARNKGLLKVTGEYILFVDSDDYIEKDTCMKFIKILTSVSPDIVVGNGFRVENNKMELIKTLNSKKLNLSGKEYLKRELKNNSMKMMVWLNLYKKQFLLENNLYFKKGIFHEDEEFMPRVFLKAKNVLITDFIFYYYVIRENSITTKRDQVSNLEHMYRICLDLNLIYDNIEDSELRKLLKNDLFNKYLGKIQDIYLNSYSNFKDIKIDKKLLKATSVSVKNKVRLLILFINKCLYFRIYRYLKFSYNN